jgi:ABC-type Mn2+/Zn2+ transport system permease subunit
MAPLVDALLDPFRPEFMQRALVEVLLIAVPAGLLGAWVVLRRLAFLGHALGHVSFPAMVVAYLAGWSVFGAALATTLAVALGLGVLSRRPELAHGAAVAVVLSAMVALGAVLVSDVSDPGVGANSLLFGSLLAVGGDDLARSAVVAALAVVVGLVAGRAWLAVALDASSARAGGLPVRALDALLLAMLAASVSVSVAVVGSLMISGLFLVPAATARLLTRRLWTLQGLAVGLAALEGAGGLWLSVRLDAPPGACIAAVATAVFVVVACAQAAVAAAVRARVMRPSVS